MTAEWYHLFIFIFALLSIKSENDIGWVRIKELQIKPLAKYCLVALPMVLTFMYSNNQVEHLFVAYAFTIAYKKIITLLNDKSIVGDRLFPLTILSLLISFNASIIPRNNINMIIMYVYILTIGTILIGTRDINSAEFFQDIVLSHLSFFFTK